MSKVEKFSKEATIKRTKKHGAHFILRIVASVLFILAAIFYLIGAAYYGYYDDVNPVLLGLTIILILFSFTVAIRSKKKGDMVALRLVSLGVTVLATICLMLLATARVYSIAVLMLSDLERDNLEGYYALYASIGAMGLYFVGAVINAMSDFFKPLVTKS